MAGLGSIGLPNVSVTGFLSSSWIYVLIVAVIGFILIVGIGMLLFFKTFNKRVELYENVAGLGYQKTGVRKARTLKVGTSGEELLGLVGGATLTAYGRKTGRNVYSFAKGSDGYWYNIVHGDLDTKLAILDIEPVDTDVRMFHVAKDRMNRENYLKRSFMEKYGSVLLMFLFLIVLVLGMWFIVGKIGNATESLSATADSNRQVIETTQAILQANQNMKEQGGVSGIVSGIVPAS